jgi:hypothetical protein
MFRFILPICVSLAALASTAVVAAEPIRLSEPVEVTADAEVFGAPLPDKSAGMSLKALIARSDELDGEAVRVTTRVAKICQKKGCFFIAQEGSDSARVTFADYGFFLPTDSGGKAVTLVGTFKLQTLEPAMAAHLAEDLGEIAPALDEPVMEYALVATSVIVPKS